MQTAAQHAELMRKVETLNLLQDSNHLLRDERNRLGDRLQEIEAKVIAYSILVYFILFSYLVTCWFRSTWLLC